MHELTPYYTKLYNAIQNDNPFTNVNITTTEAEKGNEKQQLTQQMQETAR